MGHLSHIYENYDFSFSDVIAILNIASRGELECASEKFDGLNIVFTWNIKLNELRVARSAGDVKNGGMDSVSLARKFASRGPLTDAFNFSYQVLNREICSLSLEKKEEIFGEENNIWYSAEIIFTPNRNVINYDRNLIVIHPWPTYRVVGREIVSSLEDHNSMLRNIGLFSKDLICPSSPKYSLGFDNQILKKTVSFLEEEALSLNLTVRNTINDYLLTKIRRVVNDRFALLDSRVREMIVNRCLESRGAPSLIEIKKNVIRTDYEEIRGFVETSPKMIKELMTPIEEKLHNFAVELLKNCQSSLVTSQSEELTRQRAAVADSVRLILRDGSPREIATLNSQIGKLGSLENINSTIEGLVFKYKNKLYKVTGSFAPVNQILGMIRYDR